MLNYTICTSYIENLHYDRTPLTLSSFINNNREDKQGHAELKITSVSASRLAFDFYYKIAISVDLRIISNDGILIYTMSLTYSTEAAIRVEDVDELEQICLIDIPKQLSTDIQQSVVNITSRSGYAPYMPELEYFDYQKIYEENKSELQIINDSVQNNRYLS